MPTCPNGHAADSDDYCDTCGAALGRGSSPAAPNYPAGAGTPSMCPHCSAPMSGRGRFCGNCGTEGPAPTWWVELAQDRDYFQRRGGDVLSFESPESTLSRVIALTGERVRIGRRSSSRRTTPEIDLSQPPKDPGVSREHAVLLAQPDGSWALMDVESANGTFINGAEHRLSARIETPLVEGDQIHVGVWTTLTLHRRGPE
ncbi:MAG: FHA domain-containing protein [Actinobacteria bacterium]|nr:FHA domain-containing protein [Actinomycetota bacterium]